MRLIIVTGRSGSGKSSALSLLEDDGCHCIDNLPARLLTHLFENNGNESKTVHNLIAVGIDARNLWQGIQQLPNIIKSLQQSHPKLKVDIIFLDAALDILLRRFNETRRKHPLTDQNLDLKQALARESLLLSELHQLSTQVIDTSLLSRYELHHHLRKALNFNRDATIQINLQSFGFKYGVPSDSDYLFDVRSLPNPYWQPSLRKFTGLDQPVQNFLSQEPKVSAMIDSIADFLQPWLLEISSSSRSYITISIGCTGGKHRSVYICEQLRAPLEKDFSQVLVQHTQLPMSL